MIRRVLGGIAILAVSSAALTTAACTTPSSPIPPPESVVGCYDIAFGPRIAPVQIRVVVLVDSLGTDLLNNGQTLVLPYPTGTRGYVGTWQRVDANHLHLLLGGGESGTILDLTWSRGSSWTGTSETFTDVAGVPPTVMTVRMFGRGCA